MHFAQLAAQGFDRSSARGLVEWAAALLAHNLLLRAGELGRPDEREFDPQRDLSWSSIRWKEPTRESRGRRWAL
eukprot:1005566-Pleurochrysis_carterae.AAC.1